MTDESTASQLDELLSEPLSGARGRESMTFGTARADSEGIVLFGAGGLGARTIAGLRRAGVEPLAVADNNARRWGSDLLGLPILSPSEAAERYGKSAVFVITIWGAGSPHRYADSATQLTSMGCPRVTPYAWLAWSFADEMLPHYGIDLPSHVIEKADDVRRAYHLLADGASREEFTNQVCFRLYGDPTILVKPVPGPQYLVENLFSWNDAEHVLDCGAYDGDTLRDWVDWHSDTLGRYLALEPDDRNRQRMLEMITTFDTELAQRIEVLPLAVGAFNGRASFIAEGTASSSLSHEVIEGADQVDVVRIDDLDVRGEQFAPTFIKMDIEGGELKALDGGAETIRVGAPLLAIAAYHRQDHLWEVPNTIASLRSDYELHLRPHHEEGWDLVCYAIPPARALRLVTESS